MNSAKTRGNIDAMKLPDEHKAEILDGMLEMLDPEAVEVVEEIKQISGVNLINIHRLFKDQNGAQILPGVVYSVSMSEVKPVNHRQRMGHIVADAANLEELHTRLAEYLVKFAKDKAQVINSIPAHLSIKNIKRNAN